jgi:uncharacterized protein (DUF58 family)
MTFSTRTRYLLITAAILTASAIQIVRGYKWIVVLVGALAFLMVGNLIVYLSGSKARAIERRKRRDYWAGNS